MHKGESQSEGAQSCPMLCDPMDCSPPGASIHGTFQARILEWVAMPSSRGSAPPRDRTWIFSTAGRCLYRLSHQGSRKEVSSPKRPWWEEGTVPPPRGHTGTTAGAPRTACALHNIHSGILIVGHQQSRSPAHGSRDSASGHQEVPIGTTKSQQADPCQAALREGVRGELQGGRHVPTVTQGTRAPESSPPQPGHPRAAAPTAAASTSLCPSPLAGLTCP